MSQQTRQEGGGEEGASTETMPHQIDLQASQWGSLLTDDPWTLSCNEDKTNHFLSQLLLVIVFYYNNRKLTKTRVQQDGSVGKGACDQT